MELLSIACPAPGNCVAVGSIYDGTGSERGWGLIETLRNGSWTPAEAPLPPDAASGDNGKGNLQAVSCTSPGNCVAVGFYSASAGGEPGLIETLRNGTWTPSTITLPAGGSRPWLKAISCVSVSYCVAAGYFYTGSGAEKGLIETLVNQTWHPEMATVPQGAVSQYGVLLQAWRARPLATVLPSGTTTRTARRITATASSTRWRTENGPLPWRHSPAARDEVARDPPCTRSYAVGCATTSYCVAVAGGAIASTIPIAVTPVAASAPSPSESTSPTPQPAQSSGQVTPGHDTPQNVVDGLIQAELAGDWQTACSYYVPSVQATCTQQAAQAQLSAFTGSATVSGAQISGSEALVEVTGSMCGNSTGCNSNSDPSTGMPNGQATFQQVYDQVRSSSTNSSSLSPVPCIEQNGEWYVDAGP